MPRSNERRRLIKTAVLGAAALPLLARMLRGARADEPIPVLDEADVTAKSLGYVADASRVDAKANPNFKPGQDCSNCSQYLGEPKDKMGGCNLVLGQFVLARAWCKVWEPKPGA